MDLLTFLYILVDLLVDLSLSGGGGVLQNPEPTPPPPPRLRPYVIASEIMLPCFILELSIYTPQYGLVAFDYMHGKIFSCCYSINIPLFL